MRSRVGAGKPGTATSASPSPQGFLRVWSPSLIPGSLCLPRRADRLLHRAPHDPYRRRCLENPASFGIKPDRAVPGRGGRPRRDHHGQLYELADQARPEPGEEGRRDLKITPASSIPIRVAVTIKFKITATEMVTILDIRTRSYPSSIGQVWGIARRAQEEDSLYDNGGTGKMQDRNTTA